MCAVVVGIVLVVLHGKGDLGGGRRRQGSRDLRQRSGDIWRAGNGVGTSGEGPM